MFKVLPYHQPGKFRRARLVSANAAKRGAFLHILAGVVGRVLRSFAASPALFWALPLKLQRHGKTSNGLSRFVSGQVPRSRLVGEALHLPDERKRGRSEHLTSPDQIKPPLGSVGQLLRPALLRPRRQEWDDKGKALGVG